MNENKLLIKEIKSYSVLNSEGIPTILIKGILSNNAVFKFLCP